ncbi:MAG: type II toxin-antitoxin system VapC family toxin [Microbacteriaceae bacterium]|nr:type II toxin-antitoxin system VapC family toxin [Microbacteriaceae bacterium]
MIENAVLLDTSIGVYAIGDDDPRREPSRRLLTRAASGEFRAYASVEMIQELVHHRLRKTGDRQIAGAAGRHLSATCTLLPFDREVLDLSLELIERLPTIRGRDAVHAATALAYGIERIASTDRAFDEVPGLTRVDPREPA